MDKGVDAVIELDLSTNGKDYPNILRPHATVVVYRMSSNESTLPTLWLMRNSITLRLFLVYDLSAADRERSAVGGAPEIGRFNPIACRRRRPAPRSPRGPAVAR
jgi:hypothetical protein